MASHREWTAPTCDNCDGAAATEPAETTWHDTNRSGNRIIDHIKDLNPMQAAESVMDASKACSYTHLTLPTNLRVLYCVVLRSYEKKKNMIK